MQDHFISSGKRSERNTLFNSSFLHRASLLRQPGGGCGPNTLTLGASQRFVYGELTEKVIIVIAIETFVDATLQCVVGRLCACGGQLCRLDRAKICGKRLR